MTKSSLWTLLIVLAAGIAAEAGAQPPHWMIDSPYMPHRGRIGVGVQPMTPELREFFKVPSDLGVLVAKVETDQPAAKAGVAVGDVIVSGGNQAIRQPFDLVKAVARVPAGEILELSVYRNGKKKTLEVEPEGEAVPWVDPNQWREWFDQRLHGGSGQLRERLKQLEERLEELERRLQ